MTPKSSVYFSSGQRADYGGNAFNQRVYKAFAGQASHDVDGPGGELLYEHSANTTAVAWLGGAPLAVWGGGRLTPCTTTSSAAPRC